MSGTKKDATRAFAPDDFAQQGGKFFGFNCRVVGSYSELLKAARKSDRDRQCKQVLVFQAAHGSPGGGAACNSGDQSPDDILEALKTLANDYQVGAEVKSCYSGDLMKKFLEGSSGSENGKLREHLCLMTVSTFGRVASSINLLSGQDDFEARHPVQASFEDWFHHVNQQQIFNGTGLLSASPWQEAGLIDALTRQEYSRVLERLMEIGKMPCPPENPMAGPNPLRVCFSRYLTKERLQAYLDLMRAKSMKTLSSNWFAKLKQEYWRKLVHLDLDFSAGSNGESLLPLTLPNCSSMLESTVHDPCEQAGPEGSKRMIDLCQEEVKEAKRLLRQPLDVFRDKGFHVHLASDALAAFDERADAIGELRNACVDVFAANRAAAKQLKSLPLDDAAKAALPSDAKLEDPFTDWAGLLIKNIEKTTGADGVCSKDTDVSILRSALGVSFFSGEYNQDGYVDGRTPMAQLIPAWGEHSLLQTGVKFSPEDEQRRAACRNFQVKSPSAAAPRAEP